MKIIVWLWNPWEKYSRTRHNIGFLCVDFLQKLWDFPEFSDSKFSGIISEGNIWGEKIILLKPMTFMNLSGTSVMQIMNFYKIPQEHILIISDDIDMEFGKVRLREKWSHGGQNGLKDIILKLGNNEFFRLKIGIGRHEKISVSDWVLSKFSPDEMQILQEKFQIEVREKIEEFLQK